jgi:hypothetical protein
MGCAVNRSGNLTTRPSGRLRRRLTQALARHATNLPTSLFFSCSGGHLANVACSLRRAMFRWALPPPGKANAYLWHRRRTFVLRVLCNAHRYLCVGANRLVADFVRRRWQRV